MSFAQRGSVLAVRDGERHAAERDAAGDPVAERHADLLHLVGAAAERHLEDEVARVLVDQEERAARGPRSRSQRSRRSSRATAGGSRARRSPRRSPRSRSRRRGVPPRRSRASRCRSFSSSVSSRAIVLSPFSSIQAHSTALAPARAARSREGAPARRRSLCCCGSRCLPQAPRPRGVPARVPRRGRGARRRRRDRAPAAGRRSLAGGGQGGRERRAPRRRRAAAGSRPGRSWRSRGWSGPGARVSLVVDGRRVATGTERRARTVRVTRPRARRGPASRSRSSSGGAGCRSGGCVVRPLVLAAVGDVTPGEGVSEAVDAPRHRAIPGRSVAPRAARRPTSRRRTSRA